MHSNLIVQCVVLAPFWSRRFHIIWVCVRIARVLAVKAAAARGDVTVPSTGDNIVDRAKTLDGAPARNITSIVGVLDGTC